MKCKGQDCKKDGSYGYKGGKREYCSQHKAADMINLKGYICSFEDCTTRAAHAYN